MAAVNIREFEAAVLLVVNQPPSTAPPEARAAHQRASAYVQQLSTVPNSYLLCLQLLMGTSQPNARFFALRALASFVASSGYAALPHAARAELRRALLMYVHTRGSELRSDPHSVLMKLALVLTCLLKADYLDTWQTAVTDLLSLPRTLATPPPPPPGLAATSPQPAAAAPDVLAPVAGIDLVLRVLATFHEELIDPRILRSTEQAKLATRIKDRMRARGDVAALADFWFAVLHTYGERVSGVTAVTPGSADAYCISVCRQTLHTMAKFASWIDISLLTNDKALAVLARALSSIHFRAGVARVLHALVEKGMPAAARADLIRDLRLMELCGTLTASVESSLGPGSEDDETPYGNSGTEDDSEFGEIVARIVNVCGIAVLAVGSGMDVTATPPDTRSFIATAINAFIDMALRLLAKSNKDCGLGSSLFLLIHEVIQCLQREVKAGSSGGGKGGASSPLVKASSAMPQSPEPPALSLDGAFGAAAASGGPGSGGKAKGGAGGKGGSKGGGRDDGRPAGVSVAPFMPRLLQSLVLVSEYPNDFTFERDEPDEAEWLEFRETCKKELVLITRTAPEHVLRFLQTTVVTPEAVAALSRAPWTKAELLLWTLYWYGEGVQDVNDALRAGTSPLGPMLSAVYAAAPHTHSHTTVIRQAHELAARYPGLLLARPETLSPILQGMLGPAGLRHPAPQVRSRAAYLLVKLVRSIVKSGTEGRDGRRDAAASPMAAYADALLQGVSDFLVVPFVPSEVLAKQSAQGTGGSSGGAGGAGAISPFGSAEGRTSRSSADEGVTAGSVPESADLSPLDLTRGPSGLGSEDAQYMFEIVGLVLGQPWMSIERRVSFTEHTMGPLLARMEDGLSRLAAMAGASGAATGVASGGAPGAASVGASSSSSSDISLPAPAVPAAPTGSASGWSAELVGEVSAWMVRVMNALGHIAKGLGNVSGVERLAVLMERAFRDAIGALSILPGNHSVRTKALYLIHRLVDGLDRRLLPLLPSGMATLLAADTPNDVAGLLALLTQIALKFRAAAAPAMAHVLQPVISRVFAVMPAAAPRAPPPTGAAVAAAARTAAQSHRRRDSSDINDAPAPGVSDAESRVILQKGYLNFLQQLLGSAIVTDVLSAPQNAPRLFDILGTVITTLNAATDISVQKASLIFLTQLVKTWLPVTSVAPPAPAPGVAAAPAPAPSPTGITRFPAAAPAAATVSPLRVEAAPSPLPDPVRSRFIAFAADTVIRATWTLVAAPCFDTGDDAASSLLALEALNSQASIAIHVAAAVGGVAPSKPVPAVPADGSAAAAAASAAAAAHRPDVIQHMCTVILPSLGCPLPLATQYGEKLRQVLPQPKDGKQAYLTVARALQASHAPPAPAAFPASS